MINRRMTGALLCLGVILGVHGGKIALWKDGSSQPLQVFPYSVTSLPPADQAALRKGIRAENTRELARMLEDYLS